MRMKTVEVKCGRVALKRENSFHAITAPFSLRTQARIRSLIFASQRPLKLHLRLTRKKVKGKLQVYTDTAAAMPPVNAGAYRPALDIIVFMHLVSYLSCQTDISLLVQRSCQSPKARSSCIRRTSGSRKDGRTHRNIYNMNDEETRYMTVARFVTESCIILGRHLPLPAVIPAIASISTCQQHQSQYNDVDANILDIQKTLFKLSSLYVIYELDGNRCKFQSLFLKILLTCAKRQYILAAKIFGFTVPTLYLQICISLSQKRG